MFIEVTVSGVKKSININNIVEFEPARDDQCNIQVTNGHHGQGYSLNESYKVVQNMIWATVVPVELV